MVEYREHAAPAGLAEFVHCVWTFRAPASAAPQRIAPDGRCELIVHVGAPYVERGAGGDAVQPGALFAGQLTRPLTLVAHCDAAVIGVRFRPDGARAFFGGDVSAATDRRIDLRAVHGAAGAALGDGVRGVAFETACAMVEEYVGVHVRRGVIDADVRANVEALLAGGETRTLDGVSERQQQRRFKAAVGVSPRMLHSILRFRRVFDALEQGESWAETALAAGYFDQPQMARDFQRFLGCTAREWAAQSAGLAHALTAPETYKKDEPGSG